MKTNKSSIATFGRIVGGAAIVLAVYSGGVSAADCAFSNVAATEPECTIDVKPTTLTPGQPSVEGPSSVPTPAVTTPKQSLPVTGGDVMTLVLAGGTLVAGGAVLVSRSRRSAID